MGFNQKLLPFGTTLARQIARQNLTQFNHAFWVAERARHLVQRSFSSLSFPTGVGVHGSYANAAEWTEAAAIHQAWVYQHILVSAASLLEAYMYQITTTAMASSPELIDRSLSGVDGFLFVIHKERAPPGWKKVLEGNVDRFVKGPWKDRLRKIETVFGVLPAAIKAVESDLQKLQTKRNRIVHEFGVEGERRVPWEVLTRISATSTECQNAIKLVSSIIREADVFFAPIVGGFEVLLAYHLWVSRKQNSRQMLISGRIFTEFNDHIGKSYGRPLGTSYVKSLVAYYEALSRS